MEDCSVDKPIYLIQSRKIDEETIIHGWTFDKESAKETIVQLSMNAYKIKLGVNALETIQCPLNDTLPVEQISFGTTLRWKDQDKKEQIDLIHVSKTQNFIWITRKEVCALESFFITSISHISFVEKNAKNSPTKKFEGSDSNY